MSGEKKGLSAAIESDLYAKEKGLENQITKIATMKRKKASNQAEKYHCQSFQENNFTISKNQSQQIKQQSLLRNRDPRTDYSSFLHLQSLMQPIPADRIQRNSFSVPPQSISLHMMILLQSPVYQKMKWNSGMSTFSYELIPLPDSARKCYGYSQKFTDC